MKANQFTTSEEAQVGIGTMIVFIATILVAAVAAGVLIDTSQKLQEKSTQTGSDAVGAVATNLQVEKVYGDTNGAAGIEEIEIMAKLGAGAEPVKLSDVFITVSDGARLLTYNYATNQELGNAYTDIPDGLFYIDPVRDTDSSLVDIDDDGAGAAVWDEHTAAANDDTYKGLLNADDVVMIRFATAADASSLSLGTNTHVTLHLETSAGAATQVGFTTPNTYSGTQHYELA